MPIALLLGGTAIAAFFASGAYVANTAVNNWTNPNPTPAPIPVDPNAQALDNTLLYVGAGLLVAVLILRED